jgi:hypothetical protein
MISIFVVNFVKNLPEMIIPIVRAYFKALKMDADETPVYHEFIEIDMFIEDQSLLEPYQTNDEVDGTVGDYLEIVILYSFLSLFGLAFPMGFFLAFLNCVMEMQVDKLKLY